MTGPTRLPTTVAGGGAIAAGSIATVTAGVDSLTALSIGLLGVAVLGVGLVRATSVAFDLGPFLTFCAVIYAAVGTGSPGLTLVGTVATVLAWDLGHTARDLGRQLGREANTTRLEVARVLGSLSIGLLSATLGYAIFAVVRTGESNAALAVLVVAIFFATVALGSGDRRVRPSGTESGGRPERRR